MTSTMPVLSSVWGSKEKVTVPPTGCSSVTAGGNQWASSYQGDGSKSLRNTPYRSSPRSPRTTGS